MNHQSPAAAQPSGSESYQTTVVEGDLNELAAEISETIDDFVNSSGEFAPAELRLCFDSMIPLLEDDRETVVQFLRRLINRVKTANGMGHFHLPRPRSDEVVSFFKPLFDAVIEIKRHNGTVKQRWHFMEDVITTRWFSPPNEAD